MTEISFRDNFFRSGYLVLIGLQLQTKSIILLSHTIISNRKWTKSSFFESITEIKRTPKCLKNFMGATTCNSIYVENGASSRLYSWTPHFNLDDPVPRIIRSVFHIWVKKGGRVRWNHSPSRRVHHPYRDFHSLQWGEICSLSRMYHTTNSVLLLFPLSIFFSFCVILLVNWLILYYN